jgi:hypothetical protein
MPWGIEQEDAAIRVHIVAPMDGQWASLAEAIDEWVRDRPKAVYLPADIRGGTARDAEQLKVVWSTLADLGIPILAPR